MRDLSRGARGVLHVLLALALAAPMMAAAGAQAPAPPARPPLQPGKTRVPRTADGKPDLQGVWDFAQLTPFERPDALASKSSFSADEAEEFAQQKVENDNKDRRDGTADADVARAYNDFWWDFGTRVSKQTSLVVTPASGRVPPLTPAAEARVAARIVRYENPEERPLAERCILGFNSGPPMVPSAYNNNVQVVQTPTRLLVYNEMIHSARVVDLTRRSHLPATVRLLTGDSIGRWEGDTLVVDTTNFLKEGGFRGASANMHLVERFSRVDATTLRYDFTVDDPATWTSAWTASIPMTLTDQLMYEYACHEANYALAGVLSGARFEERTPAKR